MEKNAQIFVAGANGLVGRALVKKLKEQGYQHVLTPSRTTLDLLNPRRVQDFFEAHRIDSVFMAAGKVGGILANSMAPADFLYENALMACHVIHAAAKFDVRKLLYLGSSCIYPREASQPIRESDLLSGPLEKTNEGYAVAKILGVKLCEAYARQKEKLFISVMPTNLYGPHDHFDLATAHVIPAMMHRFHLARVENLRSIKIWGTGSARREFMHVDDAAEGLILIMNLYRNPEEPINLGTGEEISIQDLAYRMKSVVGYEGEIQWDPSKPDGTPRKLLDTQKLQDLGFGPKMNLDRGLEQVYEWARENGAFH